jgi:pyruvate kinase
LTGASIGVLAKIESADSVGNLEDILDAVDGAMVARGDLGAELPVEEVSSLTCMHVPMRAALGLPRLLASVSS